MATTFETSDSPATHSYRFGRFCIQPLERRLLRDGTVVALTPKAFDLLLVFVENPGRLLEKEALMKRLWPDTFVEEANLSNNVSLLRKVLAEGGSNDIETVPRRGYRFLANVTKVSPPVDEAASHRTRRRYRRLALIVIAALLSGTVTAGWLYRRALRLRPPASPAPTITRLTGIGRVSLAAISPDGRYVAYVVSGHGQAVRVWQVATATDVEVVAVKDVHYLGLTFSNDGNFIYYVCAAAHNPPDRALFKVPVLGGLPTKVLTNVSTPVTFSPDGSQFAFVRTSQVLRTSWLMVANTDGTGEHVISTRHEPEAYPWAQAGPAWSPDGNVIACTVRTGAVHGVVAVRLKDRTEVPIVSPRWRQAGRLAWLHDGSGLMLTASDQWGRNQIWQVSYPSGDLGQITRDDTSNYVGLGLTADSRTAVAVKASGVSRIGLVPANDPASVHWIGSGKYDGRFGLAWMPDGRIVYQSLAGGDDDLWIMAADGTRAARLTADPGEDSDPAVSPDGRYIVFGSARSGSVDLWRINSDGTNPIQLTKGRRARLNQVTRDGWVIFVSEAAGLWKVPIDGGPARQLSDKTITMPALSPDGRFIACYYRDQPTTAGTLSIIPAEGGEPVRSFNVPGPAGDSVVRWTPDGRTITFTRDGNLWNQPLHGGTPIEVTKFETGSVRQFDWARDGTLVFAHVERTADAVLITHLRGQ
jgi:DNA-binding winged helix-turn-helix (wHTH) protein/Tol biopolymer transport system component